MLHSGLSYDSSRPSTPPAHSQQIMRPDGLETRVGEEESAGKRRNENVIGGSERITQSLDIQSNGIDWIPRKRDQSYTSFAEVDTPISAMSDSEPMEDVYGNPIRLQAHDQRAVEFRERMRTW